MTDFVISEDWLQRMDNSPMLSVMQIRDLFAEARSRPLSAIPTDEQCRICSTAIRKAERERVFTQIGYVDEGGCPYDSCRHRSEATNCRDCLIDWLKKSLREHP